MENSNKIKKVIKVTFEGEKQKAIVTITDGIKISTEFIPLLKVDEETEESVQYAMFFVNKLIESANE